MRSRFGCFSSSEVNVVVGFGRKYSSPSAGPLVASSIAALSRTLRVRTCSVEKPSHTSPSNGPTGTRPRDGLNPNTPQHDAGIRIEPPPSPPLANGTMPVATATALPPDDPPEVSRVSHGFRVGPN